MRLRHLQALLTAAVVIAGCGGVTSPSAVASGAPTAAATAARTPTPTASATLPPTPAPTASPTPLPTTSPTPRPTATPAPTATPPPSATPAPTATSAPTATPSASDEGAFPNEDEALLISYVGEEFADTCDRQRRIYPFEVESVTCGTDALPFTYTLFPSISHLRVAYDRDLPRAQTRPAAGGACAEANYEAPYEIDGAVAGRLACRDRISNTNGLLYRELEWTNEALLVLAFISNRVETWDSLIDFWAEQAGPFAP